MMISRWACTQGVLKGKVTGTWLHKNRFFFHANGCILTNERSISVTFPFLRPFRFLPLPNLQMAVSSLCEFRNGSQIIYITVVKQFVKLFAIQYGLTFCLYMRSLYEASLGPSVSFQTKYQAARSNSNV